MRSSKQVKTFYPAGGYGRNAKLAPTGGAVSGKPPTKFWLVVMGGNSLTYGSLSEALTAELDCGTEDVEARRELGGRCTAYLCRGGLVLIVQVQPDERLAPVESYQGVTREDFDQAGVETQA